MTSSVRPLPRPQAGSIANANRSAQAVFLSCTCRESFTGVWNQYIAIGRRLGRIGGMGRCQVSGFQDFKVSRFRGFKDSDFGFRYLPWSCRENHDEGRDMTPEAWTPGYISYWIRFALGCPRTRRTGPDEGKPLPTTRTASVSLLNASGGHSTRRLESHFRS